MGVRGGGGVRGGWGGLLCPAGHHVLSQECVQRVCLGILHLRRCHGGCEGGRRLFPCEVQRINKVEFSEVLRKHLYPGNIQQLFNELDDDGSGEA